MAFMMPVVKNEWDIYKTNRSRRSSECSNPQACRSRKKNVILTATDYVLLKRLGMLEIGGPLLVDLPGLGLSHVAGPPVGAPQHASFLAHLLPRLPELPPVSQQKYRLLAAENRQLKFPQQVPQPARGQAQALAQEGRRQRRRPAQPLVKQSGGFGPASSVRLETDRHKTHLGAPDDLQSKRLVVSRLQQQQRR
ncbi:uncharacterized protein LOC100187734 isoform X1 [Nasonia vitripennis]|uniref:Uncharacterized protein n=1 Tax=Nasonia vitripennis TaxID=7425 RepID=A0A7M7TER7_NASVI|nr:uncharacterized protein LOC100187734 isoform X1 [Nasonia vitripennis]